jgi:hypothetical protein
MSTTTVSSETRERAAHSLLERYMAKINIAKFFLRNAACKHGVPLDGDELSPPVVVLRSETTETTTSNNTTVVPVEQPARTEPIVTTQPVVATLPTVTTQPVAPTEWWKKAAAVAATVGGLAGATALGGWMFGGDDEKQPAAVVDDRERFPESPFQYIEDREDHLP